MTNQKRWKGFLWILPSLFGTIIFYCVPLMDVIRRSVTENAGSAFVGWKNFQTVFENTAFQLAAKNTLRFIAVCIPLLLSLSLLLAVVIMRCRWENFYKSAMLLSMALPAVSVALIWKLLFHNHGVLNGVLTLIGLQTTDWLNSGASFWVLVLSYLWRNIGYDMVLWIAGLQQIENDIYEAARVDGAGEIRIFFWIILPNMKQVFYTVAVLSLLNSFKVFREAYLVAGNYPHESMYLMQHLFNNWFAALSLDKMSAASVLLGMVILLMIILLYRAWGDDLC
ncbi:MAG: sugar ABC transporter permease [Lachnospiraceae bacterium]|nr:sugar ABC transporter permease [Lachnospiraceae bacterium]